MRFMLNNDVLTWKSDLSPIEWDNYLTSIGGHPLQSALWSEARVEVDGIENRRWAAFAGDELVWMGRFEVRRIARFGRVAWMPKGTSSSHPLAQAAHDQFLLRLRGEGYLLCIEDPYRDPLVCPAGVSIPPQPQTILIDLKEGKEKIWSALGAQWRYKVRTAEKAGVVIGESKSCEDISNFFELCGELSRKKEFSLTGSERLMRFLLNYDSSSNIEARLFIARYVNEMAAGVLIIRCGRSIHYFWGATSRKFGKQRPSEALQWRVMEWAFEKGLETYDLEGIDPLNNPGVYEFKRQLGGEEVVLPGKFAYPLNMRGEIALKVGILLKKI